MQSSLTTLNPCIYAQEPRRNVSISDLKLAGYKAIDEKYGNFMPTAEAMNAINLDAVLAQHEVTIAPQILSFYIEQEGWRHQWNPDIINSLVENPEIRNYFELDLRAKIFRNDSLRHHSLENTQARRDYETGSYSYAQTLGQKARKERSKFGNISRKK